MNRADAAGTPPRLGGRILPALALAAALASGCGKPPPLSKPPDEQTGPKGDPWDVAARRLHKEPDFAGCRAALGGLNAEITSRPDMPKPPALTEPDEQALAAVVPLSAGDREEIRGAAFTLHDQAYLAECLYLLDAARSLDLSASPAAPPEQLARQADDAFAWVCRQVYPNPWLVPVEWINPNLHAAYTPSALPPTLVLRRGWGSGLERMYVFLALLQQAGLDGCLVGPPGAEKNVSTSSARGPFWAVGVRVGGDVRLYDPWRGKPFPATLGRLRANPDAHKAWFEDKANVSGVTAEGVKNASVYLAVPVNALAPRMALLEQKLKAEVGVRLAVNPVALRASFPDPKPAFWNPPQDRFAYGRTARLSLPPDQGGADTNGVYRLYLRSQLPPESQVLPAELLRYRDQIEDVGERIVSFARGTYGVAFLDPPPTPREQVQRGRFQDAARDLVGKKDQFARGLERIKNAPDADTLIRQWAEDAVRLYTALGRARLNRDPDEIDRAQKAIEAHWQDAGAQLLLDRAIAELGQAEATFLMALCKHEQAERAQARLERAAPADAARLKADAADAWAAAVGEWKIYEGFKKAQAVFPVRAAQARLLADRAQQFGPKR